MHTTIKILAVTGTAFATSVLCSAPVQALTPLLGYDFQNRLTPSFTAPRVSATAVRIGSPLGPGSASGNYSINAVNDSAAADGSALRFEATGVVNPNYFDGAAAVGSYFEFTVQSTSGTLSINRLNFVARSANTRDVDFRIGSNVLDSVTLYGGVPGTGGTLNSSYTSYSFDLPAANFQNLSSPVTFRFYLADPAPFPPDRPVNYTVFFDSIDVVGSEITPVPFAFTPLPGLLFAWGTSAGRKALNRRKQAKEKASIS